jgi:hypothetical protein
MKVRNMNRTDDRDGSTLLPMLVWGLVLVVVGAVGVMMFV